MGYTHYWRISSSLNKDKFKEFSSDCKLIAEESGIPLANGRGEPNTLPEFSEERVCFNGVGKESCETFFIGIQNENFEFCKTRMEPYDVVVVACLLCLQHHFGIEVSSDGDDADWKDGRALFSKVFPDREV